MPSSYGTTSWDITSIVQYAQSNTSEVVHLIGEYASATPFGVGCSWRSTDYGTSLEYPKLTITYTVGGSIQRLIIF